MSTLLLALRARRGCPPAERGLLHDRLCSWWASAGDLVPGAIVTVLVADQDQRPVRGGDDPWVAPSVDAVVTVVWGWGVDAWGARGHDSAEAAAGSPAPGEAPTPIADAAVAAAVARTHGWGAAEVGAWWADTHVRHGPVRAGAVGLAAPGVEQVALMGRTGGIDHDAFVAHWTERHAPLAVRHHVGMSRYVQHVVRAPVDLGLAVDLAGDPARRGGDPAGWPGADVDGVAELQFDSWADFAERFYDSPEGEAVIAADVARFLSLQRTRAALVTPTVVRDDSSSTWPS